MVTVTTATLQGVVYYVEGTLEPLAEGAPVGSNLPRTGQVLCGSGTDSWIVVKVAVKVSPPPEDLTCSFYASPIPPTDPATVPSGLLTDSPTE
jgi:hypothetical protein